MILLFIGNNKEILSAFSENIQNVNAIIISSDVPAEIVKKYKPLNPYIKLMILDINTCKTSVSEKIRILSKHFPEAQIWAVYDSQSIRLKEELLRMGFNKIISYNDDLPQIIADAGLHP